MLQSPGFLSIVFSGNLGVIKTRPGYASSIAYNIDNSDVTEILGTIAGDDTIFIVKKENVSEKAVMDKLSSVIDGMN
jgi:transcriptional regulator of arginine metabolism